MTLEKLRKGVGVILAAFSLVYMAFSGVACYYAYNLCPVGGDGTLSLAAVQMAAVIMILVAVSVALYSVFWVVLSFKGYKSAYNIRFFAWLCAIAIVMFFVPGSLTQSTANLFSSTAVFMGFVPVLAPVMLMLAAAVLMFEIIKEKNGGTLRKRK